MKKVLISIILMMLYGVCMATPNIISSEPCEYRDVSCDFFGYQKWFKDKISYEQAIEDIDMFVYLLKSSYAGYDAATKRGLRVDMIIDSFNKSFNEEKFIKVVDLSQFLYDYLKPYIQDSHFSIESKGFRKSLVTSYRVLYSNIYVKKVDNIFIVEISDNEDFKIGEKIEIEYRNLFLYPSVGENVYRIGSYATFDENAKEITIIGLEKKKKILCNVANNYLMTNNIIMYKEIETLDSVYIYIPTLMDLEINDSRKTIMDENFKKLHSVSERYPTKKNIILDLRTNSGGNSLHISKFLANLYFLEEKCNERNTMKNIKKESELITSNVNRLSLISPSVMQAENWLAKNVFTHEKLIINEFKMRKKILNNSNLRIIYSDKKKLTIKPRKPVFNGKLIILSGKNSCSSSEDAILESKNIFSKTNQFLQIGENSAGCFAYGNVWCYQLINSGIALHLPSFVNKISNSCLEGYGFIPNYWATNEDILKALVTVTSDEGLLEKLVDINNNL